MRFHSRTSFLHALPTNWRSDCRKNRRMKNRRMKNHRMRRMRPLFIHDDVERPIYRPSDKFDRELYYSGKKKRHTLKNVLLVDDFGSIHFLSDIYEVRVHDKSIADEAKYTLPTASLLYQDAGFQGFDMHGVLVTQPKRNRNIIATKDAVLIKTADTAYLEDSTKERDEVAKINPCSRTAMQILIQNM